MPAFRLTRRASVLLALFVSACGGGDEPRSFAPLRYDYLPPIELKVAAVDVEQRFLPSGVAPDVSQSAPVRPIDALRAMAEDRLRPYGTEGRAVLAITDASLTRRGDLINGSFAVLLRLTHPDGRSGTAEARVALRNSGSASSLRATLYDMVRTMMDEMNIELEFQIRRSLRDWLTSPVAPATPVEQTPLDRPEPYRPPPL